MTITSLLAKIVLFSSVLNQLPTSSKSFGFVIFWIALTKTSSNCSGAKVLGLVMDILYSIKVLPINTIIAEINAEIVNVHHSNSFPSSFGARFIKIIEIMKMNRRP